MRIPKWACLLSALACVLAVFAEDEVVRSKGMGGSYRSAVGEALALALEQHDGLTVSTSETTKMWQTSDGKSVNENGSLDDR